MLLPGGLMFLCSLGLTAYLIHKCGVDPNLTSPVGLILFMTAMWMLSHSNAQSGVPDLMPALLLRGTALGFLFFP
jgi:DHA2 family multidrug resistance protein